MQAVSGHAPHALLKLPPTRLDRVLALPVPVGAGSGFGGLLARLLTDLTGQGAAYQPIRPGPAGRHRPRPGDRAARPGPASG
jgi:hypothetical protein